MIQVSQLRNTWYLIEKLDLRWYFSGYLSTLRWNLIREVAEFFKNSKIILNEFQSHLVSQVGSCLQELKTASTA